MLCRALGEKFSVANASPMTHATHSNDVDNCAYSLPCKKSSAYLYLCSIYTHTLIKQVPEVFAVTRGKNHCDGLSKLGVLRGPAYRLAQQKKMYDIDQFDTSYPLCVMSLRGSPNRILGLIIRWISSVGRSDSFPCLARKQVLVRVRHT